jgi:serine/threonine protein kinase
LAITISEQDELAVSKDPNDDETQCPHYPALNDVECEEWVQTVSRGQLREVERFGPNVDLTSYASPNLERAKKVVFKYYFLDRFLFRRWDELNIWMRLPSHPFIVPFDRLVVDELEGKEVVVGFTSAYIPGGTVEENTSRVFKLKWLKQLLRTVDDLNLRYGIQHQDIAPRNLLVDEEADKLLVFDFNFAARIGYPCQEEDHEQYSMDRDDVKGVVFTIYEIITRDMHFRAVPHDEQDSTQIVNMRQ